MRPVLGALQSGHGVKEATDAAIERDKPRAVKADEAGSSREVPAEGCGAGGASGLQLGQMNHCMPRHSRIAGSKCLSIRLLSAARPASACALGPRSPPQLSHLSRTSLAPRHGCLCSCPAGPCAPADRAECRPAAGGLDGDALAAGGGRLLRLPLEPAALPLPGDAVPLHRLPRRISQRSAGRLEQPGAHRPVRGAWHQVRAGRTPRAAPPLSFDGWR